MADGVGKTAISTVSGAALDVTDCRSFRTTLTHCVTRDSGGHRQGESERERDEMKISWYSMGIDVGLATDSPLNPASAMR